MIAELCLDTGIAPGPLLEGPVELLDDVVAIFQERRAATTGPMARGHGMLAELQAR